MKYSEKPPLIVRGKPDAEKFGLRGAEALLSPLPKKQAKQQPLLSLPDTEKTP